MSSSSGVGRTGAFCLLYAALQELEAGNGIPDLPLLVKKMRQQRKNMLQEKVKRTQILSLKCLGFLSDLYHKLKAAVGRVVLVPARGHFFNILRTSLPMFN